MERKRNSIQKNQKIILICSIVCLVSVIILILLPNQSDEGKVIEISKQVLDQYAPQYDYLENEKNWVVSFNDADRTGTITVWVPTDTPDKAGVFLRAAIMFERQNNVIIPYFIQIDHKTIYQIPRPSER